VDDRLDSCSDQAIANTSQTINESSNEWLRNGGKYAIAVSYGYYD